MFRQWQLLYFFFYFAFTNIAFSSFATQSLFILHLIVMTLIFLLKQQKQQLFSILRCGLVGGDATVVSGCHIPLATAVVSEMGPSAI